MPPKNSGGSTKFPGGHKVIHRTAQTAFVRVVTPRMAADPILRAYCADNLGRLFRDFETYYFIVSTKKMYTAVSLSLN